MRLAIVLLTALLLVAAPVQAIDDAEFAELTVRQVTLDVTVAVKDIASAGSVWTAPYDVIVDLLDIVETGIAKVDALPVPECLVLWRDTVMLALRMVQAAVVAVGHAAGVANDADMATFAATGASGYTILSETAPAILAVADCAVALPAGVS